MKIRFTKETYASKAEAIEAFGHHSWLECDGSFSLFVSLYQAGHIVCAADRVSVDVAVLDLDHLDDAQAGLVHDNAFLDDICKALGARRIVRCDSASRVYNKQKLFVEVALQRDITAKGDKDRAYATFRKKFERLTGIQCDPRMDRPAQVTFGISTAPSPTLPPCVPSKQPANDDFAKTPVPQKRKGSSDRLPISTTTPDEEEPRWVPLNMASYNKTYGKEKREGGRFEWQTRHYERTPGAMGGHWVKSTVPCGGRHTSRARLIAAAVYNALYQNKHYDAGFTLRDVQGTVWKTIKYQFEGAEAFLAAEGSQTIACTANEWSYAQTLPLEEYYQHLIATAGAKEQLSYIPRDIAARRLYFLYQDHFVQCSTYDEAKALAGDIAQGEVQLMRKLLYHYKRRCASTSKPRGHFGNYGELLRDAPRTGKGVPIIPLRYKHNMAFRRYLKENGVGQVCYADPYQ